MGRLEQRTAGYGYVEQDLEQKLTAVWKHSYDEINDRIKTIRPDGQNIDWLTYGSGHVHSLILSGQDIVSFERDDLHREKVRHYANGISQEQHYDEVGRLTQQNIVDGHEFVIRLIQWLYSKTKHRIMRFKKLNN